ncbi:MAG: S8 family serine peptidase, partial [Phycisphaeraceae bacterium]
MLSAVAPCVSLGAVRRDAGRYGWVREVGAAEVHMRGSRCTSGLLAAVMLVSCQCGPGGPDSSNNNDNGGNANDNGGTGNTIDDLPDLSDDDVLGTGEGDDVFVPGLVLIGFDQTITDDLLLQLAASTATSVNGELVDVIPDIQVITVAIEPGSEPSTITLAEQLENVDYAEADFAGQVAAAPAKRAEPAAPALGPAARVDDLIPSANSAKFAQYQLFVTNAIKARSIASSGSGGVAVAVLDTGCAVNHPEFAGSAIFEGANYISGGSDIRDDFPGGHGTGVVSLLSASVNSGEIAGLLPGFEVTVHKVCDESGFCTLDAAVLGIIGALNGNADLDITTSEVPPADVINISFSFSADYKSLARAVFEAERRGVVVVAAAGNNGRSAAASDERF